MAKRELLIVGAFAVAGVVAYQVTAPPPKSGPRRFTLSSVLESWRHSTRGRMATASVTQDGTIAAPRELRELRLSQTGDVTVTGEDRADISYMLTVDATGPDELTARRSGTTATLKQDNLGDILTLTVVAPQAARYPMRLELRVPRRLALRVESSRRTQISGVAGLYLDNLGGEARVAAISGVLSGTYRNGTLTVSGAGAILLTLASAKAAIAGVRGATTITARNGELHLDATEGPVEIDHTSEKLVVTAAGGPVRVSGTGGDITIDRPHGDVRIDMHRTAVVLSLDEAIDATVLTSDARVRLALRPELPVTIDAVSTGGPIEASAFALMPEIAGDETRLLRKSGDRGKIILRNQHGAIEITARK
ncbi:MAG: hypothetical protein ABIW19_13160 [Vicinamibacterales bacterium]